MSPPPPPPPKRQQKQQLEHPHDPQQQKQQQPQDQQQQHQQPQQEQQRHTLAGLVSISGWCVCRKRGALELQRRSLPLAMDSAGCAQAQARAQTQLPAQTETPRPPVFFSYGTADPAVDFQLAKRSSQLLAQHLLGPSEQKGVQNKGDGGLDLRQVQRAKHTPTESEIAAAADFLVARLTRPLTD
mmetsp:Transcript_32802/g.74044  ORF Transcript_32802/g.74044 Transcript_32802/m.74044 type:complete len:185 (-) Transcript_32802:102-656(-)